MERVVLRVTAASHRGRVRERNEDAVGVQGWTAQRDDGRTVELRVPARPSATCVVADGMGGHRAGHVASRLAVETISGDLGDISTDVVRASFLTAHERIRAAAAASEQHGMGTTAVSLSLADSSLIVANVGDSRLYEIGDGLIPLSRDDSPALPGEEEKTRSHVLTQALGGDSPPVVHLDRLQLEPGLRFILCTDGLTDTMTEESLERLCVEHASGGAMLVQDLIARALQAGAPDNVTVALAEIEIDRQAHAPPPSRRLGRSPELRLR